ncbi:uncharacterized protein LOC133529677 isoform X2 [Cydia pomonella]|uniref:uncharacterized protein LOC133529677 isoform X2 n=1 Tax=Cydia pomonella TaxID=82600 RepID=UPI002ADE787D|nr:uncharacterized protein LOC133529677 isoform X2 [Cydia pomonella]
MAYLALLWKARTIEKYRLKYEKEKMNSINSKTELRSTLYQKWTVYRDDSQKKIEQIYRSLCPEGSRLANSCTFLKENSSFILKIVIGIVGGILTYSLYTVFVCQLSVWTVLGWAIGVAITLGVVFSSTVRCLVFLLIPGLFSRVGRYTLACYALVLILTGPATNTLKNLDTLSASLACGQEHIKSSVKEIKESKESPLNLLQETMSGTIERVQYLATKMKNMMVRIYRLAMSIAHVLQSSLSWLNYIELICNEKLETPYEHCTKILAQGTKDCYKEFPELSNQWDWKLIVRAVCFNLRPAEPLCVVGDFAKGSIVATVKKKLNTYSTRVQSLLSVDIHIRRSHSCCNGSQPVSQAAAGVITDLRNRADTLLAWLSWTCALTGLFLMLIILRAKYYLHMFRTRSRFDNRYVTKELRELDLKRQRQGRETVLPLNTRERAKYVATSSIRLLPSERMYLTRSIVFMVITTLKLMIHMVADYSLYWVLMNVRFHGSEQNNFQSTNRTERILVSGSGPLAATVRALLEALSVPLILPATSTAGCLPDPHPPDLRRYAQIGTLILLLWILALFEPYGLRLRHVISGRYEPERAKARAVWLYYHIIRTRSCFLKYARRKLHRQYKYMSEEKHTFKNLLNHCIPCQWLRNLLRVGPAELHCLLCCTKHRQEDLDRHLRRCETPSCPGVYCARCFMDIGQLCTICYSPEDYGDLSDVSLEKFASDDNRSDDSDYNGDDNIPLMGTQDYEINEDEKGTWSNHNKKKNSSVFLYSRCRSDNHESTPLLDCDFLNKDYTQRGMIKMKCNNNFSQVDGDFSMKSEAIFQPNQIDMKDEIMADKIIQNNKDQAKLSTLDQSRKAPMVFGDTEVTVNGITFPKRKLGAIIKIMMLLTTKDENCNKYKRNVTTKRKPFEYVVMEMFQPFELFHRISVARRNKCSCDRYNGNTKERNETSEKEIRFLFDNPGFARKTNSTEAIRNKDLQTDFNFVKSEPILKYVQSAQKRKEHTLMKLTKNLWSARRNVKRFLDIKKSITNSVIERSKYFRINCDKRFICKKRKRRNKSDIGLGLMSIVSKVFSNKSDDNVVGDNVEDKSGGFVEGNIAPVNIKASLDEREQASRDAMGFENSLISAKQNGCKNYSHNVSNSRNDKTFDIQAADTSHDKCPSKELNDVNDIEIQNNSELKSSAVQTRRQNTKKLGFWGSLRVRRRRTRSPHLFSISLKNEPSFYNFFANHKRRKKRRFKKEENAIKGNNVNDNNTRSYRESRSIDEEESYKRMAKYNGIMDMENTDILLDPDPKMSKCPKKEEQKDPQREVKFTDNEVQIQRAELKAKPTEEMHQGKRREYGVRSAREVIILYDDKNVNGNTAGKTFNFSKRMRTISQIACNIKKNKRRSVAFSDGIVLKISDTDCEERKHFIQVESNDQLENEPPCSHPKIVQYGSSDEEINSEEDEQTMQPGPIEHIESVQSVETRHCINNIIELVDPCVHEWKVEPKKRDGSQTVVSDEEDESLENSSHSMVNRCFQVKMNRNENNKKKESIGTNINNSENSLENSKSTQIKNTCKCNDHLRRVIENDAVAKLQERWCHCEAPCDGCQAPADSTAVKHIETQASASVPTYHTAVQSYGAEYAPKYRVQTKPFKGKVIKEVTERLIWPDSDDVTLEYKDETAKPKRNRNETEKANRSTTTIAKTVADVSTITSDWWSPLFERKPMRRKTDMVIENNWHEMKHKTPVAKWDPLLHHNDLGGVLSASNYLLQSEECYNQVYSMDLLTSSHSRLKKYSVSEKPSFKMYRHLRKGSKARRLNECCAWRKKVHSSSVNITPKWRPVVTEEQAHALKYYKCRNPVDKNKNDKPRKVKQEKDSEQYSNSQTNSNMWTPSIFSSSY